MIDFNVIKTSSLLIINDSLGESMSKISKECLDAFGIIIILILDMEASRYNQQVYSTKRTLLFDAINGNCLTLFEKQTRYFKLTFRRISETLIQKYDLKLKMFGNSFDVGEFGQKLKILTDKTIAEYISLVRGIYI